MTALLAEPCPYEVVQALPLDDVYMEDYQRESDHVKPIVKAFTWDDYDPIKVSDRAREIGGRRYRYSCIDGGNRVTALRTRGVTHAPAMVLVGLDSSEEANIYARQGKNRRPIAPHQRFHSELFRGERRATEIQETLQAYGLTYGKTNNATTIKAIASIERIVERSGIEGLDRTVSFVMDTWRGDKRVTDGLVLDGMDLFLSVYYDDLTEARVDRLKALSLQDILRNSKSTNHGMTGRSKGVAAYLRITAGWKNPRKSARH